MTFSANPNLTYSINCNKNTFTHFDGQKSKILVDDRFKFEPFKSNTVCFWLLTDQKTRFDLISQRTGSIEPEVDIPGSMSVIQNDWIYYHICFCTPQPVETGDTIMYIPYHISKSCHLFCNNSINYVTEFKSIDLIKDNTAVETGTLQNINIYPVPCKEESSIRGINSGSLV